MLPVLINVCAGINADGTTVPLTLPQWILNGSRRKLLINKIRTAQAGTEEITFRLSQISSKEIGLRDALLLQNFVLEHFSLFKR